MFGDEVEAGAGGVAVRPDPESWLPIPRLLPLPRGAKNDMGLKDWVVFELCCLLLAFNLPRSSALTIPAALLSW